MRKFPAALLYTTFAFAVILLFSGCELYSYGTVGGDDTNIEGALPYLLQGKWVFPQASPDDVYTITGTTIKYESASDAAFGYEGTIEFVSNYSSDSGLIIIKYTIKPTFTSPTVYNGKEYFAIYYRNLNSTWVQLANTTDLSSSISPDVNFLDEAVKKFTRMTVGDYVNWSIVQPQRRIP
jgi:hypothetical protein